MFIDEKILSDYKNGKPLKALARDHGLSEKSISRMIEYAESQQDRTGDTTIPIPYNMRKWTPEEDDIV